MIWGKRVTITPHAFDGMQAERPPVAPHDVERVMEDPEADDGATAWRWCAGRTIIVRYTDEEEEINVRSVSTTRRPLAP